MAIRDFTSQRLMVDADLEAERRIELSREQAHYVLNVLRMKQGAGLLVFNGRDGEWRATIADAGKRHCTLALLERVRDQEAGPDIDYLFAPLKRARLDYMVQKAVEMGVATLRPVITAHTQSERVNQDRMTANVIEAAEQCGVLRVPAVCAPQRLEAVLADWAPDRRLIFCDESAATSDPIAALNALEVGPLAVLVGPEGGFSEDERSRIRALGCCVPLSLGPRIMRADTAAVAVLALVNATLGDWR